VKKIYVWIPKPQHCRSMSFADDAKAVVILASVIAIVIVLAHMVTSIMPRIPMPAAAAMLVTPGVNFMLLAATLFSATGK
jgi:hypothetical protein